MQSLNNTKQKLFPMLCAVLVLFLSLMIPMKPVFASEGFGGTSETVSNSFSYVEWGFYDIAFDGNGGSGSIPKITHIRFDETQVLPSNVFTRTGYTFNGWNTKADGTGSAYADKASVVRLTNENDAVVTMYAQWKANTYTVTYDANYASGESVPTISKTSDTVTFDSGYGELPTASRTGYSFDGWYTDKTGGSKVESTTKVTTAKDHTLYAHWTAYHYNIAFNANGGSGSMAKQDVTYDKTAILNNNEFVRDGYQLLGWSTTNGGSVKYENQAAIRNLTDKNGDTIQLYAVWTPATDVTKYATGEAATHDCNKYLVSTYNSSQHWQYCSICGKKVNVSNHKLVDAGWTRGTANDCTPSNVHKYTCSCGYSTSNTNGKKSHTLSHVQNLASYSGYDVCYDCNQSYSTNYHKCIKADGSAIYAENLGTCSICGYNYTQKLHHAVEKYYNAGENVVCLNGEALAYVNYNYYKLASSDGSGTMYTSITVPSGKTNTNNGSYDQYTSDTNVSVTLESVNVSGTTWTAKQKVTYTGHSENYARARILFGARESDGSIDYLFMNKQIAPENTAPTITSITQKDLSSANGWSTQKYITITGVENYCQSVKVVIKDASGNTVASGTAATDKTITANYALGGKYSFSFTPNIEVGSTGAVYTAQVTDSFGLSSTKTFTIKNVDSKAPVITSGGLSSDWSKSKTYTLTATDTGSGNLHAQASGGSYAAMTKNGTSYSKSYKYTGDIYGSVSIIYNVKDAAGNVATKTVAVSNIDNTAPHINTVKSADLKVTVTADDINAKLNKSGSGVTQYGYINMDSGTDTDITWVSSNTFTVPLSGNYVIYAKDAVGNISNPYSIAVNMSTVFNTNTD